MELLSSTVVLILGSFVSFLHTGVAIYIYIYIATLTLFYDEGFDFCRKH